MTKTFRLPTSLGVAMALVVAATTTPHDARPAHRPAPAPVASTAPAGNAAPLYRRAIEILERDASLNDLGAESTLTAQAQRTLDDAAALIELLKSAATMAECDWGDAFDLAEAGTLGQLRHLAGLCVLQSRLEWSRQRHEPAIDALLAGAGLGRHVGQTPLLMAKLVEMGISEQVTAEMAAELPALPEDVVASLPTRLEAMPRSATFAQVILGEHAFAVEMIRQGDPEPTGGAKLNAAALRSAKPWYVAVADAAHLPPTDFAAVVDTELAKLADSPAHGIATDVAAVLKPIRVPTAAHEAREAMLRTAVDVVLNGPDAAKRSHDPFGDGPFEYRRLPSGFELRSRLRTRAGPAKLIVGRPVLDAS